ncbi:MAG: hypothetical protein ACR2MS_07315 [Weeksellaceae bacterium]
MQFIKVDYKKQKIEIQDQNKKLILVLRFMMGLNIVNAIIFYLLFNYQNDVLKWLWLVFAVLSVVGLYFLLIKPSLQNTFDFNEIKVIKPISFLGLFLILKNGKWRKIFVPANSDDAQKLMKVINKV